MALVLTSPKYPYRIHPFKINQIIDPTILLNIKLSVLFFDCNNLSKASEITLVTRRGQSSFNQEPLFLNFYPFENTNSPGKFN